MSQCTVHRKIVHSAPPGGHEGNTAFSAVTASYAHDGDDDDCDEEKEEEEKDIFEMKLSTT